MTRPRVVCCVVGVGALLAGFPAATGTTVRSQGRANAVYEAVLSLMSEGHVQLHEDVPAKFIIANRTLTQGRPDEGIKKFIERGLKGVPPSAVDDYLRRRAADVAIGPSFDLEIPYELVPPPREGNFRTRD